MKLRLWVDIAEIAASLAVVATLGILIMQINQSNKIEQAQSAVRQAQWDAQLFLISDDLPNILSKIKAVDGNDLQLWMENYDLTYAEAASWVRWLTLLWRGLETDYRLNGPSERLRRAIGGSAAWPDQELYMRGAFSPETTYFDRDFAAYVRGVIDEAR